MGLLEQEIKELRVINKQIIEGTITPEEVRSRISVYKQTEKRAKMVLQAITLQATFKKNAVNNVVKTGLLGDGAVIDLGVDMEIEVIHCPDVNKNVTRQECLDYSGEAVNMGSCQSCKNFSITRKLLMKEV